MGLDRVGKYPCPCCGHVVFDEGPGSFLICPVCFWGDDEVQLRWPTFGGGANRPSLIQAQRTHAELGAMEERFVARVRPPRDDEPIDPGWRPIDPARDVFEEWADSRTPWPADRSVLYWWRPTYWRAQFRR